MNKIILPIVNNFCFNNSIFEKEIIHQIKNISPGSYILDESKNDMTLLEKFIYESKLFYSNLYDNSGCIVEFCIIDEDINNLNKFKLNCDINLRYTTGKTNSPFLSVLTYFSTEELAVIISDVTYKNYVFKDFKKNEKFNIFFPKQNQQILFDGSLYYGNADILEKNIHFKRYCLVINLWKSNPNNIETFNYPDFDKFVVTTKNDSIIEISNSTVNNKNLYYDQELPYDFYENMLYSQENFKMKEELVKLIKDNYNENFYYTLSYNNDNKEICKKNKIIEDINFMNKLKDDPLIDNVINNRFLQRHLCQNFYSKSICQWIVHECDNYASNNGGWSSFINKSYPINHLPIEKVSNIFSFILISFNEIMQTIKNKYELTVDIDFNIMDLYVIRYDSTGVNELDLHRDMGFFTINILLSDPKDFEGDGAYFNDGITINLNQGDAIIHSSRMKHSGKHVTNGYRYVMIAIINFVMKL